MRVVGLQFCCCFSFRLLAFPVSVLVSPRWTLRNVTVCTGNPVLLCHIKLLHMCTYCLYGESEESDAYLKCCAPGTSICQSMCTYFFMANS